MKFLRTSQFSHDVKRRCIKRVTSRAPCRPACPRWIWFGSTMARAARSGRAAAPWRPASYPVVVRAPLGCLPYNLSKVEVPSVWKRRSRKRPHDPTHGPARSPILSRDARCRGYGGARSLEQSQQRKTRPGARRNLYRPPSVICSRACAASRRDNTLRRARACPAPGTSGITCVEINQCVGCTFAPSSRRRVDGAP